MTGFPDWVSTQNNNENKMTTSVCDVCCKSFKWPFEVAQHFRRHSNVTAFRCRYCGKGATTSFKVKDHETYRCILNRNGEQQRLQCQNCEKCYKSREALHFHQKTVHSQTNEAQCIRRQTPQNHMRISKPQQMTACDVCNKSFRWPTQVAKHFRTHSNDRPFTCRFCGVSMAQMGNLKSHEDFTCAHRVPESVKLENLSKFTDRKRCPNCLKYYKNVFSLRQHQRERHVDRAAAVYMCDNCEKNFFIFAKLKSHIRKAHSGDRVQCDDCGSVFSTTGTLNGHINMCHPKAATSVICDACEKPFPAVENLKIHLPVHRHPSLLERCSSVEKVVFKCDVCDKDFPTKSNFVVHAAVAHANTLIHVANFIKNDIKVEKRRIMLQCAKCVAWFTSVVNLRAHERSHKPTESTRPHQLRCKICEKSYATRRSLLCHERKHDIPKRFPCQQCPKSFSEAASVKMHMKAEHDGVKAVYQCDLCEKIFSGSSSIKSSFAYHIKFDHASSGEQGRHWEKSNNAAAVIVNGRTFFQCSKCVQRCITRQSLRQHELRHEKKEANFSCLVCQRTYSTKPDLRFHERYKHSANAKRLICSVCGRSLADPKSLKAHKNAMHNESRAIIQCDVCDSAFSTRGSLREHWVRSSKRHASQVILCDGL